MFDKYKNPNKHGIAQAADMAVYGGKTLLDKMLGGQTSGESLRAEVGKSLSATTPAAYEANAKGKAERLMKQNGMTEPSPVNVPTSPDVAEHMAYEEAARPKEYGIAVEVQRQERQQQIDLRNQQGPAGPVEGK